MRTRLVWHCPACGHDLDGHHEVPDPDGIYPCRGCALGVCLPDPAQVSVLRATLFLYHSHAFHSTIGV